MQGHRLLSPAPARAAARLGADDLAKLGAILRLRENENPACAGARSIGSFAETAFGEWEFPDDKGGGPLSADELWRIWIKVRVAAGIVVDVRLSDLRHSHAPYAVMNGENLHVAGRRLDHWRGTRTNRSVRLDDETLSEVAERVALAVERDFIGWNSYGSVGL